MTTATERISYPMSHLVKPYAEKLPKISSSGVEEYLKIAKQIGLSSAPVKQLALKDFLQREEIPVFNYTKVKEYMQSLANKEGKSWGWCPLRAADFELYGKRSTTDGYGNFIAGGYYASLYPRPVPLHALQLVNRILPNCDEVAFLISDIFRAPVPDPFLAVTPGPFTGGTQALYYVIDIWDEPDFKLV